VIATALFEIGAIPVFAVAGFLLGKLWSSSEAVFANRQRAYAHFTRKCVHPTEILVRDDEEFHAGLMPEMRDAAAEFQLYASPKAQTLVGEYMGRLGSLLAELAETEKTDASQAAAAFEETNEVYIELGKQMRRDALGWTVFGIRNWFSQDEREWRREQKAKRK
jgi:hypothetical protein